MLQKKWDLTKIEDRIQMRAIERRRPLSCVWELTYHCNFRCRMCYVRMTDEQAAPFGRLRTVDEWLDMARQIYDAGVLNLTLTGGECTLYPGFERLYEELAKMGFRLSIMSNAGAYTDSVRELFRKYPPQNAAITLYGGSNETYGVVTGDPKGFDKVVENIRYLQSIGIRVSLNFTMIRQNVLDYPKVGRLCSELGIPYTLITDITKHQRDPSFSYALESRLSPAERVCVDCYPPEEVELAMKKAEELEKALIYFKIPTVNREVRKPDQSQTAHLNDCIGSYIGCFIAWNGEMQTCVSLSGCCPQKPFVTGFEAAWEQLKARHMETFAKPSVCCSCDLASDCMHKCAARRFEGSGSPDVPDIYTCQYTFLLKYYTETRQKRKITEELYCKES